MSCVKRLNSGKGDTRSVGFPVLNIFRSVSTDDAVACHCQNRANPSQGIERAGDTQGTGVQHVCIDHRRLDVGVPKEGLNGAIVSRLSSRACCRFNSTGMPIRSTSIQSAVKGVSPGACVVFSVPRAYSPPRPGLLIGCSHDAACRANAGRVMFIVPQFGRYPDRRT
jgi:hypothetical protein